MPGTFRILLAICFCCSVEFCFSADTDSIQQPKFYAGIGLGDCFLSLHRNSELKSYSSFYLGLSAGYRWSEKFQTGIGVNGLLIQPYGKEDPSKGISISNVNAELSYLPFRRIPCRLLIGMGYSIYTNHNPDRNNASGMDMQLGVGYFKRVYNHTEVGLNIFYGLGKFKEI